jgi:hypothetical protein
MLLFVGVIVANRRGHVTMHASGSISLITEAAFRLNFATAFLSLL